MLFPYQRCIFITLIIFIIEHITLSITLMVKYRSIMIYKGLFKEEKKNYNVKIEQIIGWNVAMFYLKSDVYKYIHIGIKYF
jgi:hypothetical protein